MSTLDWQARRAGATYDLGGAGGSVTTLTLRAEPEPSSATVVTLPAALPLRPGTYRFDIPDTLPPGRYWGAVHYIPSAGAPPAIDHAIRIDLPTGAGLVAAPEEVADKLRIPLPLTETQRDDLRTAIEDAQSDVEAYLARPLIPQLVTLAGARPAPGVDLTTWKAWAHCGPDDDFTIEGLTVRSDGTYDVQLRVGLDGAAERPIRRYIVAHAAEACRNTPGADGDRRVSSLSAEGQSISYDGAPGPGQAGSLPTLLSLDGYRQPPVYVRPRPPIAPWPAGGRY
ncbi:hypothetical protein [Kitasatospora sp. NPDC088548]|uniref:hypothetical protein n=1 Tax=Kitasatospora sp. NPDC088548 TaxID=3364075 RepID=UPI0038168BE5